ncbi:NAD-dependent epimerase/dehydratase family protein [Elongatibacter sediminis]|uniref:NAD-dependent epimerase/dehydratase family protein n=1 Tax=Elongatibacter sediminis TaxID=3119006 RepID=A0AAW9RCZ6_9GAMM
MRLIVTGAAGFIGMHVALALLERGHAVTGVDTLDPYYDPRLKSDRLARLERREGFRFERLDVADTAAFGSLVRNEAPQRVVHLAAQPGVRYSIDQPMAYVHSNLVGFASVLEACRHAGVPHLVYASSSSVYGDSPQVPFSEHDPVDHPLSLYAASKRANELMAHVYAHLYRLPVTGLRFFTVYGPWGRPDMAPIRFARAISEGETIRLFNYGDHQRDFTYVDDIVAGVLAVALGEPPSAGEPGGDRDPASSDAPFRVYNIGNSRPVELMEFLRVLETCLGREGRYEKVAAQPGDVHSTWADCSDLERDYGYRPDTPLERGVADFVAWFREYYGG